MDSNLNQTLIIFVALINLGGLILLTLHILAERWRKDFEKNQAKAHEQWDFYSQKQKEGTQYLSRCVREEPFKKATHELSKYLLAMQSEIQRLEEQQVALENELLDAGGNLLRSILLTVLILPFFQLQRQEKSRKLSIEWQGVEKYARAVASAQADVDRVGTEFYQKVQSMGQSLGEIELLLRHVWDQGLRGASLDAAMKNREVLQALYDQIPEVLRNPDHLNETVFDPSVIKNSRPILLILENSSPPLGEQARKWNSQAADMERETHQFTIVLDETEEIISKSRADIEWDDLETDHLRLKRLRDDPDYFPKSIVTDLLAEACEQVVRLKQDAAGLMGRVQQTVQYDTALKLEISENARGYTEIVRVVNELASETNFPIQLDISRKIINQVEQQIHQIGEVEQRRSPAGIENALHQSRLLKEDLGSLNEQIQQVVALRRQFLALREPFRVENAKNWGIQTKNLWEQIHYTPENFQDQDDFVRKMVADGEGLEERLRHWMAENPAVSIMESRLGQRCEQLRSLEQSLAIFKQNWLKVNRRLEDLKQLEGEVSSKFEEGLELLNDLRKVAHLQLFPPGIPNPIRDLDRRADELKMAMEDVASCVVETNHDMVVAWVQEILDCHQAILAELNRLLEENQKELTDQTREILEIANLRREKMVNDWQEAIKIWKTELSLSARDLKKPLVEVLQEKTALLKNLRIMNANAEQMLELLKEKKFLVDRERKIATINRSKSFEVFSEKWPPTRVSMADYEKNYSDCERRWANITAHPDNFDTKIGELQDLEATFEALGRHFDTLQHQVQRDRDAIHQLDYQLVNIERNLRNILTGLPEIDETTASAIRVVLKQIGSEQRDAIKTRFIKKNLPVEVAYHEVEADYRALIENAQQPVQIGQTLVQIGNLVNLSLVKTQSHVNRVNLSGLNDQEIQKVFGYLIKVIQNESNLHKADRIRARNELRGIQVEIQKYEKADLAAIQQRVQTLKKISFQERENGYPGHDCLGLMLKVLADPPGAIASVETTTLLILFKSILDRN